jgi:magnesium-transporting ATPase (P-type)
MSVPGVPGDYKYTPEELASICLQDNSYVADKEKDPEEHKAHPNRLISSRMIEEKFGGIQNIMNKLHVHQKNGINGSRNDLAERRKYFGENRFPPPKIKTLWELVMDNFDDPINRVLLAAAVVSLVIGVLQEGFPGGLIEGTSIIIALTIIIVVGSVNNYRSERKLAELVGLAAEQEVRVIR